MRALGLTPTGEPGDSGQAGGRDRTRLCLGPALTQAAPVSSGGAGRPHGQLGRQMDSATEQVFGWDQRPGEPGRLLGEQPRGLVLRSLRVRGKPTDAKGKGKQEENKNKLGATQRRWIHALKIKAAPVSASQRCCHALAVPTRLHHRSTLTLSTPARPPCAGDKPSTPSLAHGGDPAAPTPAAGTRGMSVFETLLKTQAEEETKRRSIAGKKLKGWGKKKKKVCLFKKQQRSRSKICPQVSLKQHFRQRQEPGPFWLQMS